MPDLTDQSISGACGLSRSQITSKVEKKRKTKDALAQEPELDFKADWTSFFG
jgi:hypothetical protein